MSRPSLQFYPKDWRANSKLRRCTPAARGTWIDVICALHDSDEYGIARYPLRELASEVGANLAHIRELVIKGVMKGDDKALTEPFVYVPRSGRRDGDPVTLIPPQPGPIWYSSRMVKDEYVRSVRIEGGSRFSEGDGEAPKPAPKPPLGDGSSSSTSSATAAIQDSGAVAPPAGAALTAKQKLWALGVPLLGEAGRGLLGKLASEHGEELVASVLTEATVDRPIGDVKAWVIATCEARNGHRPSKGRQRPEKLSEIDFNARAA